MVYTNIKDINYPFLHDAAVVISKRYNLNSIYMDKWGGICITLQGLLTEAQVIDVLMNISPWDSCASDWALSSLDYSYSNDIQQTYIYSPDGIDYRTLKTA